MRKLAITLASAVAALGFAAPASATWYGQPAYGYSYGYNAGYGHARGLQYRIDRIQRDIAYLAQYRMISRAEYYNLRANSRELEQLLFHRARFGLSPRESYDIQRRIARLESKLARDVRDGRRYGYRWL